LSGPEGEEAVDCFASFFLMAGDDADALAAAAAEAGRLAGDGDDGDLRGCLSDLIKYNNSNYYLLE